MCRQGGHVVLIAGAVIHVGEHDDGGLGVDRGGQFLDRIDQAHRVPAIEPAGQALRHVDIGREVAALGDDDAACRLIALGLHVEGGRQCLEQIERGGVVDDDFAVLRADQAGEVVAKALGQVEPAGRIPAADQVGAPFAGNDFLGAGEGGLGPGTERIAIEVDDAVGQIELLAQRGEGIRMIAGETVVTGHRGSYQYLKPKTLLGRRRQFNKKPDSGANDNRCQYAMLVILGTRGPAAAKSGSAFSAPTWLGRICRKSALRRGEKR